VRRGLHCDLGRSRGGRFGFFLLLVVPSGDLLDGVDDGVLDVLDGVFDGLDGVLDCLGGGGLDWWWWWLCGRG
jgi:hypothetical protein